MGFKALVFVWDWETKKPILFHESHKVRVESVAFTSCENYVISLGGRDDANVVVYDLNTSEAICGTFSSNKNAGDALTLAALNLRGICFLSGGVYTLKVWTLNPKNRAVSSIDVTLRKIKRKINCIIVDDNDEFAWCGTSTGDIMKVKLNFSKDLNNFFPVFPPTLIACYAKHPKGKGNPNNNVTLWGSGVRCLILLGNKKLIGAGDGTIELVEEQEPELDTMNKTSKLSTPTYPLFKVVKHAEVGSFVTSMQLQGKNNVLIGTIQCEMFVMDLSEFKPKLIISCHTSTIFDIAFPAGYSHVFATASKNDVRVWSVDQSKELLRITVPNFTCSSVLFSHDGKAIWTGWNDGNIRAFTPQSGKLITTIFDAHNKGVSAIAATMDGKKLLSGGIEGQIRIWELKGVYQKLTAVLKEHKGPVSSIDISPSDLEAASASTDGTCIIWDIQKCVRIAILFSQTLFMGVKYHPSGCQLLTCGTNRQIGYWEIFDGSLIREVEGSISAALNTLDVSHDGNFYITGGNDYYVKVWLYKEGITTHIGLGHPAVITAAAIAPDCSHIVSCSADGAIFIWKSPYSALPKVGAEQAKKEKEETIGSISQEQSVKAVSQPTEDNTKQENKPPEGSIIKSPTDIKSSGGSKVKSPTDIKSPEGSKVKSPTGIIKSPEGSKVKSPTGIKAPEGNKIKTPSTEGSVKCYCKAKCDCKPNQLPQSPKSRLETEAENKIKMAEGDR
ncbi:cilia- and flagella-associated protein 52 isoform X2 [Halyomorpha halys]